MKKIGLTKRMEYYSSRIMEETLPSVTTQQQLEVVMLSEIRHTQKVPKYYMFSLIYGIVDAMDIINTTVVAGVYGEQNGKQNRKG